MPLMTLNEMTTHLAEGTFPEQEPRDMKDDGNWEVDVSERGVFLSSDGDHDAVFQLTGNFSGNTEKRRYAQLIADRLNMAKLKQQE